MRQQEKKKQRWRSRAEEKKEEGFAAEGRQENPAEENGISNRRF